MAVVLPASIGLDTRPGNNFQTIPDPNEIRQPFLSLDAASILMTFFPIYGYSLAGTVLFSFLLFYAGLTGRVGPLQRLKQGDGQ
jgi:hypothetical protein